MLSETQQDALERIITQTILDVQPMLHYLDISLFTYLKNFIHSNIPNEHIRLKIYAIFFTLISKPQILIPSLDQPENQNAARLYAWAHIKSRYNVMMDEILNQQHLIARAKSAARWNKFHRENKPEDLPAHIASRRSAMLNECQPYLTFLAMQIEALQTAGTVKTHTYQNILTLQQKLTALLQLLNQHDSIKDIKELRRTERGLARILDDIHTAASTHQDTGIKGFLKLTMFRRPDTEAQLEELILAHQQGRFLI